MDVLWGARGTALTIASAVAALLLASCATNDFKNPAAVAVLVAILFDEAPRVVRTADGEEGPQMETEAGNPPGAGHDTGVEG